MIWADSPCWLGCWGDGKNNIEAIRNPKIEFVLTQHPWMENGCLYSDIILPINTKLEEEDIGTDIQNGQYCLIFPEHKCVEPIGESKSDFEAVGEVAKKLGVYDKFTEGKTDAEWIRAGFDGSGVQRYDDLGRIPEKKDILSFPLLKIGRRHGRHEKFR